MRHIIVILLISVATSVAKDLVVGTSYNTRLAWRAKVNVMPFPFMKRVKEVFYSNSEQTLIRGVILRDLERIGGSVESITAGGVGVPYVNVRLKSARGRGLNYQIEIYT